MYLHRKSKMILGIQNLQNLNNFGYPCEYFNEGQEDGGEMTKEDLNPLLSL